MLKYFRPRDFANMVFGIAYLLLLLFFWGAGKYFSISQNWTEAASIYLHEISGIESLFMKDENTGINP